MSEIPDFYDAIRMLRDGEISPADGRTMIVKISDHTIKPIGYVTEIDLEVHADYLADKRARLARREIEQLNVLFYCDDVRDDA